jgi:hypothetical protein
LRYITSGQLAADTTANLGALGQGAATAGTAVLLGAQGSGTSGLAGNSQAGLAFDALLNPGSSGSYGSGGGLSQQATQNLLDATFDTSMVGTAVPGGGTTISNMYDATPAPTDSYTSTQRPEEVIKGYGIYTSPLNIAWTCPGGYNDIIKKGDIGILPDHVCVRCASGYTLSNDGEWCYKCSSGTTWYDNSDICSTPRSAVITTQQAPPCPQGSLQGVTDFYGQTVCRSCPQGFTLSQDHTFCELEPTFYTSPTRTVSAFTYPTDFDSFQIASQRTCPQGKVTYDSSYGYRYCYTCDPGKNPDFAQCYTCPSGSTYNAGYCLSCPAGTTLSADKSKCT